MAGWIRPHCSFLKRLGSEGPWDDPVSEDVRLLASELLQRARKDDPVKGRWSVDKNGKVII